MCRAHNEYTTLVITLSDYQKAMADITASFQSLSQEMIVLRQVVSDHSLLQAAKVLDQIQAQEKHKLTLTAEWQVLVTVDTEAEEFDLIQHTHNLKTLRQKYEHLCNVPCFSCFVIHCTVDWLQWREGLQS